MRFSMVDVEELVEQFAELLDNVVVMVEEEPSAEDLESVGMNPDDPEDELFGLYHGIPLTERDSFYDSLPDRVVIYAGPIGRACRTRREAIAEIRDTLIHEIGHYFGMEEDQMPY